MTQCALVRSFAHSADAPISPEPSVSNSANNCSGVRCARKACMDAGLATPPGSFDSISAIPLWRRAFVDFHSAARGGVRGMRTDGAARRAGGGRPGEHSAHSASRGASTRRHASQSEAPALPRCRPQLRQRALPLPWRAHAETERKAAPSEHHQPRQLPEGHVTISEMHFKTVCHVTCALAMVPCRACRRGGAPDAARVHRRSPTCR